MYIRYNYTDIHMFSCYANDNNVIDNDHSRINSIITNKTVIDDTIISDAITIIALLLLLMISTIMTYICLHQMLIKSILPLAPSSAVVKAH